MDRMFCYLWHESTDKDECKFGDRWVFDGQDPMEECLKRIRESLGVRKDKFGETVDPNKVVIWDVSDLAKSQCPEKFKQHGKVDDYIRGIIGFRKGKTGDVHSLSADEMQIKVNNFLRKSTQTLPAAGLSQWQYDAAEDVMQAIGDGKRTILAELCARFGKTIWAGALTLEANPNITVIASYVLTSFASFEKDLTGFEQFRYFEVIDSAKENYQSLIEDALAKNRQVVVFISLCGSEKRQDRIDYLFGLPDRKLLIVDEADYGAHRSKQADPLIAARHPNDVVILMTGTNGDRACGDWGIDHYLGTTYAELLLTKAGK